MKDFFISYTQVDRKWAEWIGWKLEDAEYTVVIQAWDFRPGANFVLEMDRAIRETRYTIAVLSPGYLEADYTHPEWAAAFASDPKGLAGRLKPVRVADCRPTGLLEPIIYIDLFGVGKEEAARRLLEGVQVGRGKPIEPPPFPGKPDRAVPNEPEFPGVARRGGLLPQRPSVERLADLQSGKQVMVPLDAIHISGNRQCFVQRDAACLGDDTPRSDVIRIGSVGHGTELILYMHSMMQEHRWEMNQRVGSGVLGLLPIVFVNEDPLRVLPPRWDAFLQEIMPARYLQFTVYDLMSIFEAGRYSVAPEDVLVTGKYEDEAKHWLRLQARCRVGDEFEVRLSKDSHNGPGSLTVSVAHLQEHGARLIMREAVTPEVERDYVEVDTLPVLH